MKSQNGWPVLTGGSAQLRTWTIPTPKGNLAITLRNGSAGFLLCHFLLWYSEEVEPLVGGIHDDWGYAFRPIRGQSSGFSNHAAGCAVDANATRHPLGKVGTLAFNVKGVRALTKIGRRLALYKGVIRAGAFYKGRKDEMHYEVNAPLASAEKVAISLLNSPRGIRILKANPGQFAVIVSGTSAAKMKDPTLPKA